MKKQFKKALWKLLNHSDYFEPGHDENGRPTITISDKLFERLALDWAERRHTPEYERFMAENIGQPVNDDWPV